MQNEKHSVPICMCLGLSIGTALGVAMGNLSVYMPVGLAVGLCIGALMDTKNRKKSEDTSDTEEVDN